MIGACWGRAAYDYGTCVHTAGARAARPSAVPSAHHETLVLQPD